MALTLSERLEGTLQSLGRKAYALLLCSYFLFSDGLQIFGQTGAHPSATACPGKCEHLGRGHATERPAHGQGDPEIQAAAGCV